MEQIEIVRRTRQLFEESGSIPTIRVVDPSATGVKMKMVDLANKLMEIERNDLTEEEKGLKGFFTPYAEELFVVTMATKYGLPGPSIDNQANLLFDQALRRLKIKCIRY
jgi:hypothetical protein